MRGEMVRGEAGAPLVRRFAATMSVGALRVGEFGDLYVPSLISLIGNLLLDFCNIDIQVVSSSG